MTGQDLGAWPPEPAPGSSFSGLLHIDVRSPPRSSAERSAPLSTGARPRSAIGGARRGRGRLGQV